MESRGAWQFIWDLLVDLRAAMRTDTYVESFADVGVRRGEAEERLRVVASLIKRAYGFATGKRRAYEEDVYGQKPLAWAFLQLWGCQNQVLALRYKFATNQPCLLLRRGGSGVEADVFWDPRGDKPADGKRPLVEQWQANSNRTEELSPYKSSNTKRGHDTSYVSLLLFTDGYLGENNLYTLRIPGYSECLIDTRNNLKVIHGRASKLEGGLLDGLAKEHIEAVAKVTRALLML